MSVHFCLLSMYHKGLIVTFCTFVLKIIYVLFDFDYCIFLCHHLISCMTVSFSFDLFLYF